MADLDTLRPEVGEAITYCDGIFDGADNGEWACIRAELRRLAGIESELANVERGYEKWKRSAESVGAELAALKARIKHAPRADGQRVFDLLCLPIEFDGTLALVKMEG